MEDLANFLAREVLDVRTALPAVGLALHVAQLAGEEMCRAWESQPPPSTAWEAILAPYIACLSYCRHNGIVQRIWCAPLSPPQPVCALACAGRTARRRQ